MYWISSYDTLERRGVTVWLVDAGQTQCVAERKSDVQCCHWMQKSMSLGLWRAVWRRGYEVCMGHVVVRPFEALPAEHASWLHRLEKVLAQMNIQLTEVLAYVTGVTGHAIVREIVATQRCWPGIATFAS